MSSFTRPVRYDPTAKCVVDARRQVLINVAHAHLSAPKDFDAFGAEIVKCLNEYPRLLLALRSLNDAVIEADGQLAKDDPKMQTALRLTLAALAAAGPL